MFLDALQVVVFVLGCISFALAVRFIWFFSRSNHHLSKTMRFFLGEQIVTSAGTLAFSINSLLSTVTGTPASEWNNVNPTVAIAIRAVMFCAMIQSTTSLSRSILTILHERDNGQP